MVTILATGRTLKDELGMRTKLLEVDPTLKWQLVCAANGMSNQQWVKRIAYGKNIPKEIGNVADFYRSICLDVFDNAKDNTEPIKMMKSHRQERWYALYKDQIDIMIPWMLDSSIYIITHGNAEEAGTALFFWRWRIECLSKSWKDDKNLEALIEGCATESKVSSLARNAPKGTLTQYETVKKKLGDTFKPKAVVGAIGLSIMDVEDFKIGQEILKRMKGKSRTDLASIYDEVKNGAKKTDTTDKGDMMAAFFKTMMGK